MRFPLTKINLKIAGFNIRLLFIPPIKQLTSRSTVTPLLNYVENNLGGFLSKPGTKKTDFLIEIRNHRPVIVSKRNNQIMRHYLYFFREEKRQFTTFLHISPSQFETILVRSIQQLLSDNHGFILHASANKIKNKAVLFTGNKGDGKSTSMTLLNPRYHSLADDSVIIKKENGSYFCYQLPMIEKNAWIKKDNHRYPIDKVFFLKKALFFKMRKITNKKKLSELLLNQIRSDEEYVKNHAKNCMNFVNGFKQFYYLYFKKNHEEMIEFFS